MKYVIFWAQGKQQIFILSLVNTNEQYTKIYILSFCDLFLFLVGEKYNIFQSRSLYTNRLLD
jgi:hypothetical protein